MDDPRDRARQAIESLGNRGRTSKIPPEIRSEVLAYALPERARGTSWREIAEAVGLSSSVIKRWATGEQRDASKPSKLVRVKVGAGNGGEPTGQLVLVTPAGYRLEGLAVGQALELLRTLA